MTSTISTALLLFLILDPLGNIPVFLSILKPLTPARRAWVERKIRFVTVTRLSSTEATVLKSRYCPG